jgi:hypothetical protein
MQEAAAVEHTRALAAAAEMAAAELEQMGQQQQQALESLIPAAVEVLLDIRLILTAAMAAVGL